MAKTNFTQYQGSTFTRGIYIKDALDAKIDLSGFSFRSSIKSEVGTATIKSFTFTALDSFNINMFLSSTDTALMSVGEYVYDVERFTANDAYVDKILAGTFTILGEVTT